MNSTDKLEHFIVKPKSHVPIGKNARINAFCIGKSKRYEYQDNIIFKTGRESSNDLGGVEPPSLENHSQELYYLR